MILRHLVFTISVVLVAFSAALLAASAVAWAYGGDDVAACLVTTGITAAVGLAGLCTTRMRGSLTIREGYAVVSLTWIVVGIVGALPYLLSGVVDNPVAALFESVSGFTTTGATVLTDIEALPHGIVFWRSLTQWPGGMGPFDAVMHAFTTMPTGGLSIRTESAAAFGSPLIEYALSAFMHLAGVNFVLHFRAFSGRLGSCLASDEWRFYTGGLIVALALVLALVLLSGSAPERSLEETFRDSLFQVVSLATTTGYVSADYTRWPLAAQLVLVALMLMGAMAGSTGGGIRTLRAYVLVRAAISELRRSLHPRAAVVTQMGPKALEDSELLNISGFVLLFFGIFFAGLLVLAWPGHDLETAVGASVAAIANIGPGLGAVGPVDHYGWMDPVSHLVLIGLMIVGRLEIFTVLLLLHPDLWRRCAPRHTRKPE